MSAKRNFTNMPPGILQASGVTANAIERLHGAVYALCGCAGKDDHLPGCKYVTLAADVAAVKALLEAAKRIVDCSVYELPAVYTTSEDARLALAAAVRRVETGQ